MESSVEHHDIGASRDYVPSDVISSNGIGEEAPMVFVIDDDISARESLEPLIRTAGWRSKSFASAEEFLRHGHGSGPCCLILDLALPGLSGLELQKQLAGQPEVPIIFISGYPDVPRAVEAMKAGAVEFLTKPFSDIALLHSIAAAIERSRAALRHDADMGLLRHRYSTLTVREREVMALVVSGLLNKQVGAVLGINEVTVKAHRGRVMRRMAADSLPDLVTMAIRLGLLPAASTEVG